MTSIPGVPETVTPAPIAPERRVVLAGASNFRDLGGYYTEDGRTVRWHRVFRSDALQDLTPEDIEALLARGIRNVFDLRSLHEVEAFGSCALTEHGVSLHHVPMVRDVRDPGGMAARLVGQEDHLEHARAYVDLLDNGRESIRLIFETLLDAPEDGLVFHCTGGRDRTGLVAALLLSMLRVPRKVIADDYALTTRYLSFPEHRIARLREIYGDKLELKAIPPTHAEVMALTLAEIDARFGSPEAYLRASGITPDWQNTLREMLVEAA